MLSDEQIQKMRESIQKDSHLNLIGFAREVEQAARREALNDAAIHIDSCVEKSKTAAFRARLKIAAHEVRELITKEQTE